MLLISTCTYQSNKMWNNPSLWHCSLSSWWKHQTKASRILHVFSTILNPWLGLLRKPISFEKEIGIFRRDTSVTNWDSSLLTKISCFVHRTEASYIQSSRPSRKSAKIERACLSSCSTRLSTWIKIIIPEPTNFVNRTFFLGFNNVRKIGRLDACISITYARIPFPFSI